MKSCCSYTIIIVSFLLSVTACRHSSMEHMATVEEIVSEYPDSAIEMLSKMNPDDSGERALKSLLILKAYESSNREITMEVLQPVIDHFITEKEGSSNDRQSAYYYYGQFLIDKDAAMAMEALEHGKFFITDGSTDSLIHAKLLDVQASLFKRLNILRKSAELKLEASDIYASLSRDSDAARCVQDALAYSILAEEISLTDSICSLLKGTNNVLGYFYQTCQSGLLDHLSDTGNDDKLAIAYLLAGRGQYGEASKWLGMVDSVGENLILYKTILARIQENAPDRLNAVEAYKDVAYIQDSLYEAYQSGMVKCMDLNAKLVNYTLQKDNLLSDSMHDFFLCISLLSILFLGVKLRLVEKKLAAEEKSRIELERDNLRLAVAQLEDESENLKKLLEMKQALSEPVEHAIKERISILNSMLAREITDNDNYAAPYRKWISEMIHDRDKFMNSTRLAFKASHPRFIEHLEAHGLTESEINYACLFALGLRGKEIGEYIQSKRHYNISSEIRKKLGLDEHDTNLNLYIQKLIKIK